MPISISEERIVHAEVEAWTIGTPDNPTQAGRPLKKKIKTGSESSRSRSNANSYTTRRIRCSQTGYYQNTCCIHLANSTGDASSSASNTNKRRKPKACSICGVVGHTRLICRDRASPQ